MEAINQESLVAPGDIQEAPISITTTEANLTGSWKFFKPWVSMKQAPCVAACPLHNALPRIMQEVLNKDWEKALSLLRLYNPLPAITGRVCPSFCQQHCSLKNREQEVLSSHIEKYLGDLGLQVPYPAPREKRKERVAVIGSGPAGLCASYFLALAGIKVSILEKEELPGGLLRYGIPAYRLPRDVLQKEIDNLLNSLDIELSLNQEIQADEIPALLQEFDFVFCAPGLGGSIIPEEFQKIKQGVLPGLNLLKELNQGLIPRKQRFAVVGGGNVAVDVARSLVRCAKQVQIIYRRSFQEMPAYPEEKTQALEEGVRLFEERLVGDADWQGNRLLLKLNKAEKSQDSIQSGDRAEELEVDSLVLAVGQSAHMNPPELDRVFLGGDYKTGAATVALALASGKDGAQDIIRRIDPGLGSDIFPEPDNSPELDSSELCLDFVPARPYIQLTELDAQERSSGFAEIRGQLNIEDVLETASRCLGCGTCNNCGLCWFFCPDVSISLPENESKGAGPEIDEQHCKGCGLCAAICPRGVIKMQEDL